MKNTQETRMTDLQFDKKTNKLSFVIKLHV